MKSKEFKHTVWKYFRDNKRDLPWRKTTDPYHILVSEMMLQQTQVQRVMIKYPLFISAFPTFEHLAKAQLKKVLEVWQGMGYNRRALYLHLIAKKIMKKYNGIVPNDPQSLSSFPGIGSATAGAILAFAFNKPSVFIETNIRRVYIHHFFHNKVGIADKEILQIIEETVDKKNPREWYYALMDYGAMLGKVGENPNRRSQTYSIQSKFEGSDRQMRGFILKSLLEGSKKEREILKGVDVDEKKTRKNIKSLEREGFIKLSGGVYQIM